MVNIFEVAGLFVRSGDDAAGYPERIGPFVWVVWVGAVSIAMVMRGSNGAAKAAT